MSRFNSIISSTIKPAPDPSTPRATIGVAGVAPHSVGSGILHARLLLLFVMGAGTLTGSSAEGATNCSCDADGTCRITDVETLVQCNNGGDLDGKDVVLSGTFYLDEPLTLARDATFRASSYSYTDSTNPCTLVTDAVIDGSTNPATEGEIFGLGTITVREGTTLAGIEVTNGGATVGNNACVDVIGSAGIQDSNFHGCWSSGLRVMATESGKTVVATIDNLCVSDITVAGMIAVPGDFRITKGTLDPRTGLLDPIFDGRVYLNLTGGHLQDGRFNMCVFGGAGSVGGKTHVNVANTKMELSSGPAIRVIGGQDVMLDPYPGGDFGSATLQFGPDVWVQDGPYAFTGEAATLGGAPLSSVDSSDHNVAKIILHESAVFHGYEKAAFLVGPNLIDTTFAGENNLVKVVGAGPPGFEADIQTCLIPPNGDPLPCPESNEIKCSAQGCP